MAKETEKSQLSLTSMSPRDTVRLLSKVSGETLTEDMLVEDLEAGAPTNPDGTINLVHYAAWLVKQMGKRPDS